MLCLEHLFIENSAAKLIICTTLIWVIDTPFLLGLKMVVSFFFWKALTSWTVARSYLLSVDIIIKVVFRFPLLFYN